MSNVFFENEGSVQGLSETPLVAREDVRRRTATGGQANPVTPIPARASVYPIHSQGAKVRSRYIPIAPDADHEDITRLPTHPAVDPLWEYETVQLAAESRIPNHLLQVPASTPSSPSVDELDTLPQSSIRKEKKSFQEAEEVSDIAELATQPPGNGLRTKKTSALLPENVNFAEEILLQPEEPSEVEPEAVEHIEMVSWTAGQGAHSLFAQRIAQHQAPGLPRRNLRFHPFDRLRWWLLYPGRLEFVLWLSGTLFLLAVTSLLLLLAFLSFVPLHTSSPAAAASTEVAPPPCLHTRSVSMCGSISVTSEAGVKLLVLDTGQLVVNQPLHLEGQGFTPHGAVNLTYDAWLPCQPAMVRADAHGTFQVAVLLTEANVGTHRIAAYDVASTHTIVLPLKLIGSTAQNASVPTVVATLQPIVPTAVSPIVTPSPVISQPTPVVPQPTAIPIAPSPTPQPTATPVAPLPTPQPTVKPTPKPVTTPTPREPIQPTPTVPRASIKSMDSAPFSLFSLHIFLAQVLVLFAKCWLWLPSILYSVAIVSLSGASMLLMKRRVGR